MRIVAHLHQFVPVHNAGAEWMAHDILQRLQDVHGFDIDVIVNRGPRRRGKVDGMWVQSEHQENAMVQRWAKADVAITHLDATAQAMRLSKLTGTPLVHLVHNHDQLRFNKVTDAALIVANSEWVLKTLQWPGDAMVVIPPVWPDRVLPPDHEIGDGPPPGPHNRVTLINMAWAKGAQVLFDLAERLPDIKFMGVVGAYAQQGRPKKDLPNLELVKHTANIWQVYALTRVLLMPSSYESWGRCAVEAGWCHVPTIAGDTPGLRETGVPFRFLPADAAQGRGECKGYDVDQWVAAVKRMVLPEYESAWRLEGSKARHRAELLEDTAKAQVDDLAHRLEKLA